MLKALQWALGVNDKLVDQVNLALLAAPLLNDGGSITLTTGVLAQEPIRHGASAAMVNAAIEGFVRTVAIELPRGIGFQPQGRRCADRHHVSGGMTMPDTSVERPRTKSFFQESTLDCSSNQPCRRLTSVSLVR